jgi:hypothetical protein
MTATKPADLFGARTSPLVRTRSARKHRCRKNLPVGHQRRLRQTGQHAISSPPLPLPVAGLGPSTALQRRGPQGADGERRIGSQGLARWRDHVKLPPIKPVTTRINLHRPDCRCCGNTITAEPPADRHATRLQGARRAARRDEAVATSRRSGRTATVGGSLAHRRRRGSEPQGAPDFDHHGRLQREIGALTEPASTSTPVSAETVAAPREKTRACEDRPARISFN